MKMESDGLEDTLLGPWQLYDALDEFEDMVALLAGMVTTMTVATERLAEAARRGWTQATDLAAMLTREAGISWRERASGGRAPRARGGRRRPRPGGRHRSRHRPGRDQGAGPRARRNGRRHQVQRSTPGNRSRIAGSSTDRPRPPSGRADSLVRSPRSAATLRASKRWWLGSEAAARLEAAVDADLPTERTGFALNALSKFGIRRLLFGLPTIWLLVTVVFAMVHLAPGDPLTFITGEGDISSEQLARLRQEYGLDRRWRRNTCCT
jgi:hypothetical protein